MALEFVNEGRVGEHREPLASFLLLAYNQERFISEAVRGALAQSYSPLEIIISDDCSPDRTWELLREQVKDYEGPHRLVINRNEQNMGLCAHFNKVCSMAKGEVFVLAAGDDISLPDRVTASMEILARSPDVYATHFRLRIIDEQGETQGLWSDGKIKQGDRALSDYLAGKNVVCYGASQAYRKEVFSLFGPLTPECPVEDMPMMLRALLLGKLQHHEAREAVYYRVHGGNLSISDAKKRLDFQHLYNQIESDADKAVHANWATIRDKNKLMRKWTSKLEKIAIEECFEGMEGKLGLFVKKVVPTKHLSIKHKLYFFRKALRKT